MNVGLMTEQMNIGGASTLALRQARWLKAHGHVAVVLSAGGPLVEDLERDGIAHMLLPSFEPEKQWTPEQLIAEGALLQRVAQHFRLDAVVAQARWPYAFAESAMGASVPVFFDLISPTYYPHKTAETASFVRRAAAAGRILSGSVGDGLAFASAFDFDPRTIHVVNLPIDPPRAAVVPRAAFRSSLGIVPDEIVVLTVARLDADRAPMILPTARAVASLSQRLKVKVRYVVVGDGTEGARLRSEAPKGVIFTSFRRDLPDFYNAADVFVGEGSVVQDAAAAGLPVIVTSTTGKPHLGGFAFSIFGLHLVDRYYTAPSNVVPTTPIEEALSMLLEFPEKRSEIAASGRALVEQHWDLDEIMRMRLEILSNPAEPVGFAAAETTALEIEGNDSNDVTQLASALSSMTDTSAFAAVARKPVAWRRYFAMPLRDVHALCSASWRTAYTPARIVDFKDWREAESTPG